MFLKCKLNLAINIETASQSSSNYYDSYSCFDIHTLFLYNTIYILYALHGGECDKAALRRALERTTEKRGSSKILTQYSEIMQEIRDSDTLRRQWNKYGMEYDYAKGISFDDTCNAIQAIMNNFRNI